MSGGVIAVVVPLYLAECLSAGTRGRGTAVFQFMLTIGIVLASIVGLAYTHQAEAAIAAAAGNAALITAADNAAWRNMFLSVVYPGLIFFDRRLLSERVAPLALPPRTPREGHGRPSPFLFGRRGAAGNGGDRRHKCEDKEGDRSRARYSAEAEICCAVHPRLRHPGLQSDNRHQLDSRLPSRHSQAGRPDLGFGDAR